MVAMICDPSLEQRLIAQRKALGIDRFDEVWNEVYLMAPMANNEHQRLANRLAHVLTLALEPDDLGTVYPGANVSDQDIDWETNYRCPDVVVFLRENAAEDRESHWFGGPDLAIEIVSPGDRSYEKLEFYASVGTREVLIVDRDPWRIVLFRLHVGKLIEAARSTLEDALEVASEVVPLSFQLVAGEHSPQINVAHHDGQQRWVVKSAS
jgi:Uma2 family endonuclease